MNILMLCTQYSLEKDHSWLTDSLAEELARDHRVVVVYVDWKGTHGTDFKTMRKGVEIFSFQPKFNSRFLGPFRTVLKWFFSSRLMAKQVEDCLKGIDFDLIINFSPALALHPLVRCAKGNFTLMLINWDFFPIYHYQLGLIPKPLYRFLKRAENAIYNKYHIIGLMSPRNVDFIKSNYSINKSTSCQVVPLWGPSRVYGRKVDTRIGKSLICVFGGQLIPGRGIEKLIELAIFSKEQGIDAKFEIYGDGPERNRILKDICERRVGDLVAYRGSKPREVYLKHLASADIGLVFNSGKVTVPTIPSKCIDFFRAGIPILAYVEEATDFGEILENQARAGWSFSPKTADAMFSAFKSIAAMEPAERALYGSNGQKWYLDHMTVEKVAKQITDLRVNYVQE